MKKRLINVYFYEKPIIDFFQNAEYEKDFISLELAKE